MAILRHILTGAAATPHLALARVAQIRSDWQLSDMRSPFWRCYLPLERGGVVTYDGVAHALDPSRIMLIAPQTAAAASHHRDFRKAYANLSWDPEGRQPRPAVHEVASLPSERRRLRQLVAAGDGSGLSLFMLEIACRAFGVLADDAFASEPTVSPLIADAMAILQGRLADPPSNQTLGRALGLHPGSLVRRFTAEVGCPPQRFSRECRLAAACRLLVESDDTIEQIAEATGFGDRAPFTRAFSRRWLCAPAAFRRRHS